jgi:hypothetical protein
LTQKQEIINLFNRANISDSALPSIQEMGYGKLATFNAPVMRNMFSNDGRIVCIVNDMFNEAKGAYRQRSLESFNPIFWIESIIFLPRSIISYLGLSTESIMTKILLILWWFITPLAYLFREKILIVFMNFFN